MEKPRRHLFIKLLILHSGAHFRRQILKYLFRRIFWKLVKNKISKNHCYNKKFWKSKNPENFITECYPEVILIGNIFSKKRFLKNTHLMKKIFKILKLVEKIFWLQIFILWFKRSLQPNLQPWSSNPFAEN